MRYVGLVKVNTVSRYETPDPYEFVPHAMSVGELPAASAQVESASQEFAYDVLV
jgi:hypothetical protein